MAEHLFQLRKPTAWTSLLVEQRTELTQVFATYSLKSLPHPMKRRLSIRAPRRPAAVSIMTTPFWLTRDAFSLDEFAVPVYSRVRQEQLIAEETTQSTVDTPSSSSTSTKCDDLANKLDSCMVHSVAGDHGTRSVLGTECVAAYTARLNSSVRGILHELRRHGETCISRSTKKLSVALEKNPALLTDALLNPKANRERMTQVMFYRVSTCTPCTWRALLSCTFRDGRWGP